MASTGSLVRISAKVGRLDAGSLNAEIAVMLGRKAESITKNPTLRKDIASTLVQEVNKYVPMKTGKLRESGRGTTDGRMYWTAVDTVTNHNYAATQYNTQYRHYTTPGTGPLWVPRFVNNGSDWSMFISHITPMVKEGFKDG